MGTTLQKAALAYAAAVDRANLNYESANKLGETDKEEAQTTRSIALKDATDAYEKSWFAVPVGNVTSAPQFIRFAR